ncbi:hypothetical protein [Paraburkholderia bannensis]|uniref:hypothetical protein n=1 Tax=Paraburkholderia bannensis TaxID=765414 RepID=UPI002AB17F44|nr:hypothetical protein [Paraburkholderia bannensis]
MSHDLQRKNKQKAQAALAAVGLHRRIDLAGSRVGRDAIQAETCHFFAVHVPENERIRQIGTGQKSRFSR